jgi:hypothetical protein
VVDCSWTGSPAPLLLIITLHPSVAARALPCATRAIKRQTAGRRFTNPNSKTRPALRLRLHHPGRWRSLDAGLPPAHLDHMDYSRKYTCICRTLERLGGTFLFLPVTRSVHEARCPVKSRSTTCPETDEVRVSPLPNRRTNACLPTTTTFNLINTSRTASLNRATAFTCSALFTTCCAAQCDTAPEIGLVGASAT